MALALDFEVICCDPREEYHLTWDVPGTTFSRSMPDDVVHELQLDPHCAVVAVTHDPKLDDMVLLEALKSPAFYVGALGSRGNTAKRKERLKLFDLSEAEIDRLHGPIGLHLGARTPAEIAVSIVAEIVAVKNGVGLAQKKPGSAMPLTCPAETALRSVAHSCRSQLRRTALGLEVVCRLVADSVKPTGSEADIARRGWAHALRRYCTNWPRLPGSAARHAPSAPSALG
jgi:hypothetical protein